MFITITLNVQCFLTWQMTATQLTKVMLTLTTVHRTNHPPQYFWSFLSHNVVKESSNLVLIMTPEWVNESPESFKSFQFVNLLSRLIFFKPFRLFSVLWALWVKWRKQHARYHNIYWAYIIAYCCVMNILSEYRYILTLTKRKLIKHEIEKMLYTRSYRRV